MFETILYSILGSVSFTGVLGFFLREAISNKIKHSIRVEYEQKLFLYKNELQLNSDSKLATIKADLQVDAERRSIQFSNTFQKIAETVATVYEKLVTFQLSVASYVHPMSDDKTKPQKREEADKALNEYLDYFNKNKIYLPAKTAENVSVFSKKLLETAKRFQVGVEQGYDQTLKIIGDTEDSWVKTHSFMEKDAPQILLDLEVDLRDILGVEQ